MKWFLILMLGLVGCGVDDKGKDDADEDPKVAESICHSGNYLSFVSKKPEGQAIEVFSQTRSGLDPASAPEALRLNWSAYRPTLYRERVLVRQGAVAAVVQLFYDPEYSGRASCIVEDFKDSALYVPEDASWLSGESDAVQAFLADAAVQAKIERVKNGKFRRNVDGGPVAMEMQSYEDVDYVERTYLVRQLFDIGETIVDGPSVIAVVKVRFAKDTGVPLSHVVRLTAF